MYGQEGSGGPLTAEAQALLDNPKIHFDDVGMKDLKAGRIDPRVVAALTKLSKNHEITISCMCSDHPKFTTGGSVSNHAYGRGVDIATIDGEIVRPGSPAARELATSLAELDPTIRPNEIGTPFAIASPGYFTDGAHQDHIHFAFKEPIDSSWKPPADLQAAGRSGSGGAFIEGAPGTPAPVAAAAAAPGAPAPAAAPGAPAPAAGPAGDSGSFMAVTPDPSPRADGGTGKPSDSGLFKSVPTDQPPPAQPPPPPAQAAAAPAAPVAGAPAADPSLAGNGARELDLAAVSADYPGDSASKDQLAAWMAKKAEEAGLPRELPVMAGLVESGLRNIHYGDADSVGFFQMRVGIWNKGEYAGYPQDPQLQLKWFFDRALEVKRQRLSAGKPIDDPNQFGEWIADVERPAEQYRGRYQLRLAEARNLLRQAGTAQPAPAAATPVVAAAEHAGAAVDAAAAAAGAGGAGPKALAALAEAQKYMGTPYKWGGSAPGGFDCSGLMQYAYKQAGIDIPRIAEDQFNAGTKVDRASLQAGDLVSFADPSGYVHHIGMYIGDGKFVHAPHTGDVVKVSSLDEPYFKSQFAGGTRVDKSGATAGPGVSAAGRAGSGGAFVEGAVAEAAAAPAPVAPVPAPEPAAAPAAEAAAAEPKHKNDSQIFMAISAQEASFHKATAMFMQAVSPETAAAHKASLEAAAPVAPVPAAPVTPVPAAPVEAAPAPAPAAAAADPAAGSRAQVDQLPADVDLGAGDYPGDSASQAELAKWLAREAKRAGLPPELPVMASLVESGVKNLHFGDADSVGFFQMRVGIWNKGDYAGYPQNPHLQAKWFIDQALAVKKQRIARGLPIDDPNHYGDWIADIERPAEQYRGRYQLRLGEARKLLGT
jgi:cell wall-associated NlpC family hydrolase